MYRKKYRDQSFLPFVRYQYYNGGKKHEMDARSYLVWDWEVGMVQVLSSAPI